MNPERKAISAREWAGAISVMVVLKLAMLGVFGLSHHYLPRARYQSDIWMTRPGTTLFQNLANFDGAWFVRLAAIGYQKLTSGEYNLVQESSRLKVMDELGYRDGIERRYAYRHWPLFPLMLRAAAYVLHHNFLLAGVLLVSLFYFGYGCFFYKLARLDFPPEGSLFALALALAHPGAYSLTAIYNEPVFLCFASASLYFMRRDRYLGAGICGCLAGMTRIEAVVLYVPIIYEYLRKSAKSDGFFAPLAPGNFVFSLRRVISEPRSLWLFLVPLGSAAVLLYFRLVSGNAFIFVKVHEANLYGHFGFPWQMLYATYLKGPDTWLKELPLHALLLLVIIFSFRKINRTFWVWAAAFWLFYTTNGNHSYLRYQVMAVPMFLGLAALLADRPGLRYAALAASASAMAFFGAMYINGYWVA